MTKTLTGVLALTALAAFGTAAQATEPALPFHATLQVTEGCDDLSTSDLCLGFADWVAECQAKGYSAGFQAARAGYATFLGSVTSFEQGCLEFTPTGVVRSNVQMTVTPRNGKGTLTFYANALFDFAGWSAPLNPPPATGTFTITAGTGRYAQARGSGTLGNVFGEGNAGWVVYLDGSLRFVPRGSHSRVP
jgi:hypothetical protein